MYKSRAVTVFLAVLLLSACGKDAPDPYDGQHLPVNPPEGSLILTSNTYAADALSVMLSKRVAPTQSIIAAGMVNLDDMNKSSPLARISMQQISSRLGQQGFKVVEPRLSANIKMDVREGEFMLTRNAAELLSTEYNAHSALVGAYSDRGNVIFMSVRVVRISDNAILAAYEYYLPKQGQAAFMLEGGGQGGSGGTAGDFGGGNAEVWKKYNARPQGK